MKGGFIIGSIITILIISAVWWLDFWSWGQLYNSAAIGAALIWLILSFLFTGFAIIVTAVVLYAWFNA